MNYPGVVHACHQLAAQLLSFGWYALHASFHYCHRHQRAACVEVSSGCSKQQSWAAPINRGSCYDAQRLKLFFFLFLSSARVTWTLLSVFWCPTPMQLNGVCAMLERLSQKSMYQVSFVQCLEKVTKVSSALVLTDSISHWGLWLCSCVHAGTR